MALPKKQEDQDRLLTQSILWLATSYNDLPHLVPIWYVVIGEDIFICTGLNSIKARNISRNPHISISLQDGVNPLIALGNAIIVLDNYPQTVIDAFKEKYDWNIENDPTYNCLIKITTDKWLHNK